jgi:hypothetical protein
MMTSAFILVALIFAIVELVRSKAQSLLAWAVLFLALVPIWPLVR